MELRTSNSFEQAERLATRLRDELGRAIIGQHAVVQEILAAFFAGGHCLLRGVPGLAKTLLIKSLARAVHLNFSRIQFTPDLMPSDILGTEVIEEDRATGRREIRFIRGPIFANVILADEINRTPPKTQAALLEAMQEYQVTVNGVRYDLDRPLFVLATQNPIEQEGTYPLPEAQLDRFMFNVVIDYPSAAEEHRILSSTTTDEEPAITPVATAAEIEAVRHLVREVPAASNVVDYALRLVRASRPAGEEAPPFVRQWVKWGAGPRAGQSLILGAKARALLDGRSVAALDDIRAVALPVMRHRVLLNFQAEADGVDTDQIVAAARNRSCTMTGELPDVLAGIADLELVARIVVEGLVSGLHRSPFHGYSAEFSQYRHYRPGDDLKYVDWKLVARTGRVYTKQFRETTNMAASIVIDTSASMLFPGPAKAGPYATKFRYATILAAALAHLIATQGDAIGLVARDRFMAPRTGRHHLRALLAALSTVRTEGEWNAADVIRRGAERLKRRGLLVVLSDLYDAEDRVFAELRRAARMGHEVILFHVMSRDEIEFPYANDVEFSDLETGRLVAVNGREARRTYTDALAAFLERWRSRAGAEAFQYSLVVTDTPPAAALRKFILSRRQTF